MKPFAEYSAEETLQYIRTNMVEIQYSDTDHVWTAIGERPGQYGQGSDPLNALADCIQTEYDANQPLTT